MNTTKKGTNATSGLPTTAKLTLAYLLSFVIAFLLAISSGASLAYRNVIYPTQDLLTSFISNDVVNLIIGLPILLITMWLTHRGKLIGLLFWPGALFYVGYNYLAYVLAMPFNVLFLVYLSLVSFSFYTMIILLVNIKGEVVRQQLTGKVPERTTGGILCGLGILFFLRVVVVMAEAVVKQAAIAKPELSVMVADFFIVPSWIIIGVLLWQHKKLGYVAGVGLLFQASMLFVGLIFFMILQPFLTSEAFKPIDIVVVFVMGLTCFIPLALFIRGVVSHSTLFQPKED